MHHNAARCEYEQGKLCLTKMIQYLSAKLLAYHFALLPSKLHETSGSDHEHPTQASLHTAGTRHLHTDHWPPMMTWSCCWRQQHVRLSHHIKADTLQASTMACCMTLLLLTSTLPALHTISVVAPCTYHAHPLHCLACVCSGFLQPLCSTLLQWLICVCFGFLPMPCP